MLRAPMGAERRRRWPPPCSCGGSPGATVGEELAAERDRLIAEIHAYFGALADTSPNVQLREIGRSEGGKAIQHIADRKAMGKIVIEPHK